MKITAKEKEVLEAAKKILERTTAFHYIEYIELHPKISFSKRSLPGVINSLCKKGIISATFNNAFDDFELSCFGLILIERPDLISSCNGICCRSHLSENADKQIIQIVKAEKEKQKEAKKKAKATKKK